MAFLALKKEGDHSLTEAHEAGRPAPIGLEGEDDPLQVDAHAPHLSVKLLETALLGTASAVKPEQIVEVRRRAASAADHLLERVEQVEPGDHVPAGSTAGDREAKTAALARHRKRGPRRSGIRIRRPLNATRAWSPCGASLRGISYPERGGLFSHGQVESASFGHGGLDPHEGGAGGEVSERGASAAYLATVISGAGAAWGAEGSGSQPPLIVQRQGRRCSPVAAARHKNRPIRKRRVIER